MYENPLRLQTNHPTKLMLSLKFYTIAEFQKCWSLFWLVYTCKICLLLLVLCQGQIHIVKEFLLSKSKNEIDFFATINQQPQVLIIGTHVIRLWASKWIASALVYQHFNLAKTARREAGNIKAICKQRNRKGELHQREVLHSWSKIKKSNNYR